MVLSTMLLNFSPVLGSFADLAAYPELTLEKRAIVRRWLRTRREKVLEHQDGHRSPIDDHQIRHQRHGYGVRVVYKRPNATFDEVYGDDDRRFSARKREDRHDLAQQAAGQRWGSAIGDPGVAVPVSPVLRKIIRVTRGKVRERDFPEKSGR